MDGRNNNTDKEGPFLSFGLVIEKRNNVFLIKSSNEGIPQLEVAVILQGLSERSIEKFKKENIG